VTRRRHRPACPALADPLAGLQICHASPAEHRRTGGEGRADTRESIAARIVPEHRQEDGQLSSLVGLDDSLQVPPLGLGFWVEAVIGGEGQRGVRRAGELGAGAG